MNNLRFIFFYFPNQTSSSRDSRQTEDWFWNEETEQPTCQRRHLLAILFIIYFMDVNFIDNAPWASPPQRKRLNLSLAEEIPSPFYLLFTLWTWNFIDSAPWASARLSWPTLRLDENFFPPFYLLFTLRMWNLYWQCILSRSPVKRPTLILAENAFSPFFVLFTLWMWNCIDSAPWASPRRRRPTLTFLIVLFIIYFTDVKFILTVHPGQKTHPETGW
jgi:hypothetical protein